MNSKTLIRVILVLIVIAIGFFLIRRKIAPKKMEKEAVLDEMKIVAAEMRQKEEQAGTLVHQRNRLAVEIVDGGTTISSLSQQLNVNYEFLQFWLQDRPKNNY